MAIPYQWPQPPNPNPTPTPQPAPAPSPGSSPPGPWLGGLLGLLSRGRPWPTMDGGDDEAGAPPQTPPSTPGQQPRGGLYWLQRLLTGFGFPQTQFPSWQPRAYAAPTPPPWLANLPAEWANYSPEAKREWWRTYQSQQQTGGS